MRRLPHQIEARGFTIIELMIVVSIVGIMTTIALPEVSKYKKKARKAESFVIIKTIADLQTAFMVENFFFVNVDAANGGYSAYDHSGFSGGDAFTPLIFDASSSWEDLGYPVAPGTPTYYAYSSVSGADSSTDSDAYGPVSAPGTIGAVASGSAGEVALFDPSGINKQCIGHGITNGDLGIDTGATGTYDFTIPYALSTLGSQSDLDSCYVSMMLIESYDNGHSFLRTPILTFEFDNPQSSGGGGSSSGSTSTTSGSTSGSSR